MTPCVVTSSIIAMLYVLLDPQLNTSFRFLPLPNSEACCPQMSSSHLAARPSHLATDIDSRFYMYNCRKMADHWYEWIWLHSWGPVMGFGRVTAEVQSSLGPLHIGSL